jgi:isopenicillin N synthase-like dioxygenase
MRFILMAFVKVRPTKPDEIPVCDISALLDGSNPLSVARELRAASTGLGFIYIKGHGIPQHIINNARYEAYKFFRSTKDQKSTTPITNEHRGWIDSGGAMMDDGAKTDLKESFLWGFDSLGQSDHSLRGQNIWPTNNSDMKIATMEYFKSVHKIARHLMRGFALGLDLDQNFFLQTSNKPLSRGSFVYYPDQSEKNTNEQFGASPHTDFGVLTVLAQDNVGGLQIKNREGHWIEAPPIQETLIVNVADLLHRWTAGAYKSTPHRVINSSGRERLSIVLAYDPNPETVIDPRDIFGHDFKDGEPPITCGDYLDWRFDKAFSYRKDHSVA